jgi:hypothetical protein
MAQPDWTTYGPLVTFALGLMGGVWGGGKRAGRTEGHTQEFERDVDRRLTRLEHHAGFWRGPTGFDDD